MSGKKSDRSQASGTRETPSRQAARVLYESVVSSDPRLATNRQRVRDCSKSESAAEDPLQVYRKFLRK